MRSHTCGELNKSNIGQEVVLAGWVHRRRDHGGIVFVDLRDRYGITQVKFGMKGDIEFLENKDELRNEWVIKVVGDVVSRPENMVNLKLKTGEIEVEAKELAILNKSKVLPFEIDGEKTGCVNENLRLRYRFLDLRRPEALKMLELKDKYIQHIRKYFQGLNFLEVQTPILANSSPEGARDFLIPSRLHSGKFYALPQAPQQFKQLLMVGGIDKYFQIAPCFRDEDPRMDRHYGEFYQLDMEMSFVSQDDIFAVMEPLMVELTETFSNKKVVGLSSDETFVKIPWRESMTRFGTDKPDLRFEMEIKGITELVESCGFSVFADAIKNGGVVHALKVHGGGSFSRKEIEDLSTIAKSKGVNGLAHIIIKENGDLHSPILKYLGEELGKSIVAAVNGDSGDIVFFAAGNWNSVCSSLGAVRNECAEKLGLKDKTKAAWCWIVDFPMYSFSEIEPNRIDFGHNPFSMPQGGLRSLYDLAPLDILAYQFDLVLNGFEVSSGAIRNHDPEIMYKAFEIAGYSRSQVDSKFGGLIRAFEYGAPPHGGNAPGIDRILMVLQDLESIRDIYAFPKDGQGRDLMMDSPCEVSLKQLEEAHISISELDNKS